MKPTLFKPSTLAAASALTAAVAAFTLTACGPNDSAETAQLAGASAAQIQPATAGTAVLPPLVDRQGTPVPPVALAPAPAYAPPPPVQVAAAAPALVPQPAYPAQSGQPTGYAPVPNDAVQRSAPEPRAADRSRVGSISSIEPIRERPQGTGAGAVIGGVLGAVVGNQFGHGGGRAVMTGAGAVGGAVAGNNIERNRNTTVTGYRVAIRLDNGATRSFQRTQIGGLQVGDRVQLDTKSFHRV
jgi:outer membrane lipoprotein SlyB